MKYWEYRMNSLRFINIVFTIVLSGMIYLFEQFTNGEYFAYLVTGIVFLQIFILMFPLSFLKNIQSYYKYILCICLWSCTVGAAVFLYMVDLNRFSTMHILLLLISLFSVFNKKILTIFILTYLLIVVPFMIISPIRYDFRLISGLTILIMFILFYIKYSYDDLLAKAYEDSLQAQKSLLENAQEAFILFEAITNQKGELEDYKFLSINKTFEKLTGFKGEKFLGKTAKQIAPNTDKFWLSVFSNALNGNAGTYTRYVPELGMFIQASIYKISENRFAALFSDTTKTIHDERKIKFEIQRSENADRLKTQFLKDVNHRLRTPLNGIMGTLQLMDVESITNENRQLFEAMSMEVFHIRNIINQISKYVDVQSINFEYTKTDVRILISKEVEKFEGKGVEIKVIEKNECEDSNFYIQKELVVLVLKELLTNAIKHTRDDKIEINLECEKNISEDMHYFHIDVKDFGSGIEREKLIYIFNEFYHHDFINIYKDEDQYSIPICKQMLLNSGGDLQVESQLGVETIFKMFVPVYSI